MLCFCKFVFIYVNWSNKLFMFILYMCLIDVVCVFKMVVNKFFVFIVGFKSVYLFFFVMNFLIR